MSLPDVIQIAFDTWPNWRLALDSPPTIIRSLPSGRGDLQYLLNAGGFRLVLRAVRAGQERSEADRYREQVVLDSIVGKPFTPIVFYCEPDRGVVVTEYLEGTHWCADDLDDPVKMDSLVDLIGAIHSIASDMPIFDYGVEVRSSWQRLMDSGNPVPMAALKMYRSIEESLVEFQSSARESVLCHHGLTPENIIETSEGQLVVLDWRDAGGGSPVIEAVGLGRYWQSPELVSRLLGGGEDVADYNVEAHELAQSMESFHQLIGPF